MGNIVSKKYAHSVFELASEVNSVDSVHADLKGINQVLTSSSDIGKIAASPISGNTAKTIVVDTLIAEYKPGQLVCGLLKVLLANSRLKLFDAIVEEYESLAVDRLGIEQGRALFVNESDTHLIGALETRLAEKLSKKVKLDFAIDRSIIGGFYISLKHNIFDGTTRTQLNNLSESIKRSV